MSSDVEQTIADLTIYLWLSEAQSVETLAEARMQLGRLAGAAAAAAVPRLSRAARTLRSLLDKPQCDEKFALGSVRRFLAKVADDSKICRQLAESERALTWVHPHLKDRVERTLLQSVYLATVLEVDRLIQGSSLDRGELEEAL